MDSSEEKTEVCPQCKKNTEVISVIYGRPSPEGIAKAKAEKIILGGCSKGEHDHHWHCKDCKFRF